MFQRSKLFALPLSLALALSFALPAYAVLDVGAVTTTIADAVVAVTAVGVAVLGVVVLIAAFRWIKRAI